MAAARDPGDARLLAEAQPGDGPGRLDYPGLYTAADAAAVSSRRQHFLAEAVQLALNPLSAGLAVLAAAGLLPLQSAVLTAVSTTILVVMLWVSRAVRWEKIWYDCRSVAEEVKTLAWRYMMLIDPFPA